jgi:hypothetical protein
MIAKWAKGQYNTLLFMKKEDDAADRIVLKQRFDP